MRLATPRPLARTLACVFALGLGSVGVLAGHARAGATEPARLSDTAQAGRLYVPVYARLPVSGGRTNVELSITLSIQNTSAARAISVRAIEVLDAAGQRLDHNLPPVRDIPPLGSSQVFLPVHVAGTAAKVLVDWQVGAAVAPPLAEAIMLGQIGAQSISFVSRGVSIDRPVGE